MRKVLSGLMLLTLVVLFAATYVCSSKTEEVFKAEVERLNQSYAGLLRVELLNYQRGLLVSEVKTQLTLQNELLPLDHQVRHFPWKVSMLTSVTKDSALGAALAERLPLNQLQLQTDIDLSGVSQSRLYLPELSFADDLVELQLQGLHFDFNLDGQLSDGQLMLQLDSITISEPGNAEFAVTDIQMNSQFTDLQGLPLGDGTIQIGKVSLQKQGKSGFELNELHYEAISSLEDDLLASGFDLQLAALKLGGETFTDGRLQLQVSGIDASAVRKIQADHRKLQAELHGQQVDPVILQLQMLDLYTQLFQAGLTISLPQLSLQADEGILHGKGSVKIQGLNLTGSSWLAFDKVNGQFQLDIDPPFLKAGFRSLDNLQRQERTNNSAVQNEQAEQLAGGLIQKGIFSRRDGGGYRLELSLEQDQVKLNGNPFRL